MAGTGEYSQGALVTISVLFPFIGVILLGVRFWIARGLRGVQIGWDDWLILLATVLVCGMGANGVIGSVYGTMGRDNQTVDAKQVNTQNKIDYTQLVIEKPAYGAIKLSVLFFYRRIFRIAPDFRKANNYVIVVIALWTVGFWGAAIFMCGIHPSAAWDPLVKQEYGCSNEFIALLIFAITDVLTNALIVWMPYPQVKKLHGVRGKQKSQIMIFFGLGSFDILVSIVRMGFILATQTVPAIAAHYHYQQPTAPTFWTILEVGVGLIAANLPAVVGRWRRRRLETGSQRLDSSSAQVAALKIYRKNEVMSTSTVGSAQELNSLHGF